MNGLIKYIIFLFFILIISSCSKNIKFDVSERSIYYNDKWQERKPKIIEESKENLDAMEIVSLKKQNDTIIYLYYNNKFRVSVNVKYPEAHIKPQGNILMLHGWGEGAYEWCDKTSFCNLALSKGFTLIIPDFGKTNYTLTEYNEIDEKYKEYPTLTWIINIMISTLQRNFEILLPENNNFVAGISTGARGATLLAYYLPKIFKGVASLSGDYDITKDYYNNMLYYLYLGDYKKFKNRWEQECIAYNLKKYNVPTFIGHGMKDTKANPKQSEDFYNSLAKLKPNMKVVSHFSLNGEHDYNYWNSETENILSFFGDIVNNND